MVQPLYHLTAQPCNCICKLYFQPILSLAGGLGMYGAASLPAAQLPTIIQDIRAQLQQPELPFGINLFVPPAELPPYSEAQQAALQQVHAYYADVAAQLQLNAQVSYSCCTASLQSATACQAGFSRCMRFNFQGLHFRSRRACSSSFVHTLGSTTRWRTACQALMSGP
jgi:hypothetical protein